MIIKEIANEAQEFAKVFGSATSSDINSQVKENDSAIDGEKPELRDELTTLKKADASNVNSELTQPAIGASFDFSN